MNLPEHFDDPEFFSGPKSPRVECTIQASGKHFDPESYLRGKPFRESEDVKWGKIGLPSAIRAKIAAGELTDEGAFEIFDMPFLLLRVSRAEEMVRQAQDAISFLTLYFDELKELSHYPAVENYFIRFSGGEPLTAVDFDPPEELYRLCSEIGINGVMIG